MSDVVEDEISADLILVKCLNVVRRVWTVIWWVICDDLTLQKDPTDR